MTYIKENLGEVILLIVLIAAVILLSGCAAGSVVEYRATCYSGGEVIYSEIVRKIEAESGKVIKLDGMDCVFLEVR